MADTPAAKKTAKAMTKSRIVATLAERTGLTRKQSEQYLEELAKLALKEAKNGFTIPGLGKLVLVRTKARTIVIPFGEKKGQTKKIAAKKVLRFRVAKVAKDAVAK